MPYAETTDIATELQGYDTQKGIVTNDILEGYIAQESALIDQYLATKYITPVTEDSPLLVLKKICIDLVTYRVTKVLSFHSAMDENGSTAEYKAYRAAIKWLERVESGELPLNGAALIESKSNTVFYAPDEGVSERVFKKDTIQW